MNLTATPLHLVQAAAIVLALSSSANAEKPDSSRTASLSVGSGGTKPASAQTKRIERHPHLAPLPGIHFDHYNSAVIDYPTPAASDELEVTTRTPYSRLSGVQLGTCLNFMVDKENRLYGFCGDSALFLHSKPRNVEFWDWFGESKNRVGAADFNLVVFEPGTMKVLKARTLTRMPGSGSKDCQGQDTVAFNLGYFTMDDRGRILIPSDENVLEFYKYRDGEIRVVRSKPLDASLDAWGVAKGTVYQVMPAYDGSYFVMGTYANGDDWGAFTAHLSKALKMDGLVKIPEERLENGMAVDSTGMYLISDKALYKFSKKGETFAKRFREPYEGPSTCANDGTLSHGSGSSPTLMGKDLVVITDNADSRVNLLVYDRRDQAARRQICKVPLFSAGASENENSVIGYGRRIFVQNFAGAPSKISNRADALVGGFTRIDVARDRSGCTTRWTKGYGSAATARLSLKTDLVYMPIENWEEHSLELAFIDADSGEEARPRQELGNLSRNIRQGDKNLRRRRDEILMMPIYALPDGLLVQPVFQGFKVIEKK